MCVVFSCRFFATIPTVLDISSTNIIYLKNVVPLRSITSSLLFFFFFKSYSHGQLILGRAAMMKLIN